MGTVRMVGPAVRLSRTPVRAGEAVGLPGADAPEISAEVGLGKEIERLVAEKAVKLLDSRARSGLNPLTRRD